MNQPAKAQEPSMEEILASIRRIISDEEPGKPGAAKAAAPAAAAPPPAAAPKAAPAPVPKSAPMPAPAAAKIETPPPAQNVAAQTTDILDLTEAMTTPQAPAAGFRTVEAHSDVMFTEAAEEPAAPAPAAPEDYQAAAILTSHNTRAAVDSAFNSLAHTVFTQNARTMEDLVRDMLRPMLKSWLDDNLPGLVERLVRAEIERVSRGR